MKFRRRAGTLAILSALAAFSGHCAARAEVRTLRNAMSAAYSPNPILLGARAQVRVVDDGVTQALSGWRPVVVGSSNVGYANGSTTSAIKSNGFSTLSRSPGERTTNQAQVALTQPLYTGGATTARTRAAENRVDAQRSRLFAAEQQALLDTVNAFVGVGNPGAADPAAQREQ